MSNLANLTISKVQSIGSKIFGHPTSVSNLINITFNTAKIYDSFGSADIHSDAMIARIGLSNEQWMSLIMSANNKNGVPCSIYRRNDVEVEKEKNILVNEVENKYDIDLKLFSSELHKLFPSALTVRKRSKLLLDSENDTKKELLSLKNDIMDEWNSNKEKLVDLLEITFNGLDDKVKNDLQNEIKNNLFGFSSVENKQTALKLLGLSNTKLLDKPIKNIETSTIDINNAHGVLVLEEIKSVEGFVEDLKVHNGYKLTLHQANENMIEGSHIIMPGKVLVAVEVSVAQFSNFISSFNQGAGQTATLVETVDGIIEKNYDDLDILTRRINEFKKVIETESDDKLLEHSETVDKITKRKIGVRKKREVEILFEQFYNIIISNIKYYVKDILTINIKTNVGKRMDIQFAVEKVIKDLGMERFNEQIMTRDFSAIEQMFNIPKKQIKE